MIKPQPCFETNKALEEAARIAEQRKLRALDRLNEKLDVPQDDAFTQAMRGLIDADKAALLVRGK